MSKFGTNKEQKEYMEKSHPKAAKHLYAKGSPYEKTLDKKKISASSAYELTRKIKEAKGEKTERKGNGEIYHHAQSEGYFR